MAIQTLTIQVNPPSGTQTGAFTVSFVAPESLPEFTTSNVVLSSGTLSNLTGSGTMWSATVTPPTNSSTAITISVSGTVGSGSNTRQLMGSATVQINTLASITSTFTFSSDNTRTAFPVKVVFSEPISGFTRNNISVTNGNVSNSSRYGSFVLGSGTEWFFNVNPNASSTKVTVTLTGDVMSGGQTRSLSGSFSKTISSFSVIESSSGEPPRTAYGPFSITETYRGNITNFTLSDIYAINCSISNLNRSTVTEGSQVFTRYTFTVTPDTSSSFFAYKVIGVASQDGVPTRIANSGQILPYSATVPTPDISVTIRQTNSIFFRVNNRPSQAISQYRYRKGSSAWSQWAQSGISITLHTLDLNSTYTLQVRYLIHSQTGPTATITSSTVSPSPAVVATYSVPSGVQTSAYTVNVTLNKSVTGLSAGHFSIGSGSTFHTISNFTGSGSIYSFTATPPQNSSGSPTISAFGNVNVGGVTQPLIANPQFIPFNTTNHINASWVSGYPSPGGIQHYTYQVRVEFPQIVSGLEPSDISVTNGTVESVSFVGSNTWGINITPTPNSTGSNSIDITGTVTQSGSSKNVIIDPLVVQFDTTVSARATITAPSGTQSGAYSILIKFIDSMANDQSIGSFSLSDVSVTNGTLSWVNQPHSTGSQFQLRITPPSNSSGQNVISFTGTVLLNGSVVPVTATSITVPFNTIPPATAVITVPQTTQTAPYQGSVTFGQVVTGFTASDMSCTNGVISNVTGSAMQYNFTVTPTNYAQGQNDIDITGMVTVSGNSVSVNASEVSVQFDRRLTATLTAPSGTQTTAYDVSVSFPVSVANFDTDNVDIMGIGTGSYTVTGSGTSWTIRVTPSSDTHGAHTISVSGNVTVGSNNSAAIKGNSPSVNYDTRITPPAITDLMAAPQGIRGVRLTFTAYTGTFTRYEYRWRQPVVQPAWTGWIAAAKVNTIDFTSGNPGIEHFFQVRIVAAITSGVSNTASATPQDVPSRPPALQTTGVDGAINTRWNASNPNGSAIIRYEYRHKLSSAANYGSIINNLLSLTRSISGLTNGSSYDFQVRAVNAVGNSPWATGSATPRVATVAALFTNTAGIKTGNFSIGVDFSNMGTGSAAVSGFTPNDITITTQGVGLNTVTEAGLTDYTVTANGDNRFNINFTPTAQRICNFRLAITGNVTISGSEHTVSAATPVIQVNTATPVNATWQDISGAKIGNFAIKIVFAEPIINLIDSVFQVLSLTGDTIAAAGLGDWVLTGTGTTYTLSFTPSTGFSGTFGVDVTGNVDTTGGPPLGRPVSIQQAVITFDTTGTVPTLDRPAATIQPAEQPIGTLASEPVANGSTVYWDIVWSEDVGNAFTNTDIEIWGSASAGGTNPASSALANVGTSGTSTHWRLTHVIPATGMGEISIRIKGEAFEKSLEVWSPPLSYGQPPADTVPVTPEWISVPANITATTAQNFDIDMGENVTGVVIGDFDEFGVTNRVLTLFRLSAPNGTETAHTTDVAARYFRVKVAINANQNGLVWLSLKANSVTSSDDMAVGPTVSVTSPGVPFDTRPAAVPAPVWSIIPTIVLTAGQTRTIDVDTYLSGNAASVALSNNESWVTIAGVGTNSTVTIAPPTSITSTTTEEFTLTATGTGGNSPTTVTVTVIPAETTQGVPVTPEWISVPDRITATTAQNFDIDMGENVVGVTLADFDEFGVTNRTLLLYRLSGPGGTQTLHTDNTASRYFRITASINANQNGMVWLSLKSNSVTSSDDMAVGPVVSVTCPAVPYDTRPAPTPAPVWSIIPTIVLTAGQTRTITVSEYLSGNVVSVALTNNESWVTITGVGSASVVRIAPPTSITTTTTEMFTLTATGAGGSSPNVVAVTVLPVQQSVTVPEKAYVVVSPAEKPVGQIATEPASGTIFFDITWSEDTGMSFDHTDILVFSGASRSGTAPASADLTNVGTMGTTTHWRLSVALPTSGQGYVFVKVNSSVLKNNDEAFSSQLFYGEDIDITWGDPVITNDVNFSMTIQFNVGITGLTADDITLYGAPAGTTKMLAQTDARNYTLTGTVPEGTEAVIDPAIDTDNLTRA